MRHLDTKIHQNIVGFQNLMKSIKNSMHEACAAGVRLNLIALRWDLQGLSRGVSGEGWKNSVYVEHLDVTPSGIRALVRGTYGAPTVALTISKFRKKGFPKATQWSAIRVVSHGTYTGHQTK